MTTDLHSPNDILGLFPADSKTADANGASVDCKDYEGIAAVVLDSEAGAGTLPTLDVKIQDSADDVTFADVAGKVFAQVTDAAAALEKIGVNLSDLRRHVRAVATITGSSPVFVFSVTMLAPKKVI